MIRKILGIDFGTNESLACVYINGKPIMIPSKEGNTLYGRTFPSDVACTEKGKILVGDSARALSLANRGNVISEIKKYLGTNKKFNINGKEYTPQVISALILNKIKMDAELFIGESIIKAVIAVPAYFDDNQRIAIMEAGRIAGLDVLHLINEPTAAILANGIGFHCKDEINVLVFDLGWSSLDVNVIKYDEGVFEVVSSSRNSNIGGNEIDNVLFNHFLKEFEKNYIDITDNEPTLNRLRHSILRTKIELSTIEESNVKLPFFAVNDAGVPLSFDETMSRLKLEELILPIIKKCGNCIDQAVHDAGLTLDKIDKVILVGGPTKMPIVKDYVENYTGKLVQKGVDPMECVSIGASIPKSFGDPPIGIHRNCIPLSIGYVEGDITVLLIKKLSEVPFKVTRVFTTEYDNQTELEIELVRGESLLAEFNTSIGSFILRGIPPAPKGMEKIEVTFEVDVDGLLNVTALVISTGKEQSITVSNFPEITPEEIMHAPQKTKESEIEFQKRFLYARIKYEADLQIYSAQRLIHDSFLKNKIDIDKIKVIERLILELEDALDSNNLLLIKVKTTKLCNILENIDLS